MTNRDLYQSIGEVSDAFLLECEIRPSRRPRRFVLIAAVIALMLTACAPAAIQAFNALSNDNVDKTEAHYKGKDVYEVTAQIEISPDAPYTIETRYFPTAMEPYLEGGTYSFSDWAFSLRCYAGEGRENEIFFLQSSFTEENRNPENYLIMILTSDELSTPETTLKTYGEVQVMEFDVELQDSRFPEGFVAFRNLCWSDGMYFYFLQIPEFWTDEQATEMVSSLTVMEDLSAYPITQE